MYISIQIFTPYFLTPYNVKHSNSDNMHVGRYDSIKHTDGTLKDFFFAY